MGRSQHFIQQCGQISTLHSTLWADLNTSSNTVEREALHPTSWEEQHFIQHCGKSSTSFNIVEREALHSTLWKRSTSFNIVGRAALYSTLWEAFITFHLGYTGIGYLTKDLS